MSFLNEFISQKYVKNMSKGEALYGHYGSVVRDSKGGIWVNLNGKVSKNCIAGLLNPLICKIGDDPIVIDVPNIDHTYIPQIINFNSNCDYVNIEQPKEDQNYEPIPVGKKVINNDYSEILLPLNHVFFPDSLLNEILIKTSIPEIITGKKPLSSGIILFGEGGTGKTVLQKALSQVYINAGHYAEELNVAALSDKYVASLSHNLDAKIATIAEKCRKNNKCAFVFLDEATSIVLNSTGHSDSTISYYQEGIDVLKKYIANFPELVFSITTNADKENFDGPLIRDGRLSPIFIPAPELQQKADMWKYFINKYNIFDVITKEVSLELGVISANEMGSFIDKFCKNYLTNKILLAGDKESSLLKNLMKGNIKTIDSIKKDLTLDKFKQDLKTEISNREIKPKTKLIGFR